MTSPRTEAVVEGRPVLTLAAADHAGVVEALAELLLDVLDREAPPHEAARAGGNPAGPRKERGDVSRPGA